MLRVLVLLSCAIAVFADCGRPAIDPVRSLIVGGNEAVRGSWPWQVGIIKNYKGSSGGYHMCGGTLVGNQWIVTAAHCFYRWKKLTDYTIALGSHDSDVMDSTQINAELSGIWVHENYDDYTLDNDVAILKLQTPVTLNDHIDTACLATDDYPVGKECYVTGWGDQETSNDVTTLQEVAVPIIDTETCNRPTWYNGEITDNMFCAGLGAGGIDSCQGDSGGPVVCQSDSGTWDLFGIVSWGYGCADALKPGVYTRVPRFNSWINGIINNN